ncbi:MAG: amino acid permease [Ignavibacteriota bacterium]
MTIHPGGSAEIEESRLRKQLGLGDLILAQILCCGGLLLGRRGGQNSARAHVVFWVAGMLLFYLPLAAVVVYLNRLLPLEGGLYQWAKAGFGEMPGFLTAWNLWVYAVIVVGSILLWCPPTWGTCSDRRPRGFHRVRSRRWRSSAAWSRVIAAVAIHGLDIGKWLHNAGSVLILLAYAILLPLPLWAHVAWHAARV